MQISVEKQNDVDRTCDVARWNFELLSLNRHRRWAQIYLGPGVDRWALIERFSGRWGRSDWKVHLTEWNWVAGEATGNLPSNCPASCSSLFDASERIRGLAEPRSTRPTWTFALRSLQRIFHWINASAIFRICFEWLWVQRDGRVTWSSPLSGYFAADGLVRWSRTQKTFDRAFKELSNGIRQVEFRLIWKLLIIIQMKLFLHNAPRKAVAVLAILRTMVWLDQGDSKTLLIEL